MLGFFALEKFPLFDLFQYKVSWWYLEQFVSQKVIKLHRKKFSPNLKGGNISTIWIKGLDKQKLLSVKLSIFSYPSVLTYVLGAQKNNLIETFPLSTHIIYFDWGIRFFWYTLNLRAMNIVFDFMKTLYTGW